MNMAPYQQRQRKILPGSFEAYDGGVLGEMLEYVEGLYIYKVPDWKGAIIGIESQQVFGVYDVKNRMQPMFHAKEKSGCCQRAFLKGSCHSYQMNVYSLANGAHSLWLEREYTCTMYCLNRPRLKVNIMDPNGQILYLGAIEHTFTCCAYNFKIEDETGRQLYSIETPACQKNLLCNCPCQGCQQIDFSVMDASGTVISRAEKQGLDLISNAMTNAAQFCVMFTDQMPWSHRALLMCAMLFINYEMFEKEEGNERDRNDRSEVVVL